MKRAVSILLAVALVTCGVTPAFSDDAPKDPRKERERVRREKAKAAADLDALQADAGQLDRALDDLADNIAYQESLLAVAKSAQISAGQQVVEANAKVTEMESRIATLEAAAKQAVLRAYTSAGSAGDLVSTLVSSNPVDALQQQVLYGLVADDISGVLDELTAANRDLEAARKKANSAALRADDHRRAVEDSLAALQQSEEEQQDLADRIDSRIDETLAEAANLETLDATLSKQIAEREAALAAKVRTRVKANVPTATVTDDGDIQVPVIPTPAGGLVRVNGITVDASIGPAVSQLVEWAARDGIQLTGGGFRSAEAQIQTRRNNCGSSNYDIWQKPPSQCRPPAARPGHSMHEKGLAIDFVCNGALITSYGSFCFAWMADHAPRVGLHNRRGGGEAWHWSTTGN